MERSERKGKAVTAEMLQSLIDDLSQEKKTKDQPAENWTLLTMHTTNKPLNELTEGSTNV